MRRYPLALLFAVISSLAFGQTAPLVFNNGRVVPMAPSQQLTNPVSFTQSGTGAVASTVQTKLLEAVSVKDYNAKGDGATDDTAAINATLSANPGKLIYLPPGTYVYNGGGTLTNGTVLSGAGRNATTIQTTSATADLFTVSGYGAGIRSVAFNSAPTRTAGTYVILSGPDSFLDDFNLTGDFVGVNVSGVGARVTRGYFYQGASGADRIRVTGGNSQVIDQIVMGQTTTQNANAGIHLTISDSVRITNTAIIKQGYNLLVDSASTTNTSLKVSNSFFDFSNTVNVKFVATGTGNILRSTIAQSWIGDATASDGMQITNAGTGTVSGVHLVSDDILNNFGAGVTTSGTMSDISVIGTTTAHNAYGLYFGTNVTGITVGGNVIGAGAGFTGNTNEAIHLSSGDIDIAISGNNLVGNGSAIVDATAAGIRKNIIGNVGWNPIALTGITVGASPFTWINSTGAPATVFVNVGTVSQITLGGNIVGTGTNTSYAVPNNASLVVTYSSIPNMSYMGM